ncbi:MAG TPA: hypothetical protein VG916_12090 [Gemmatimonadaceae bacterium]|nr:hypothetical protein [Gemmatimonadaceae bacterium]
MLKVLLTFHMLGLVMGFSAPLANMTLGMLARTATPEEMKAYMKFPPRIARVSDVGLVLLILSGIGMVFVKYGGFAGLPWTFQVKMTAVVVLVVAVGMIHANMKKAFGAGDKAALARIQNLGKVSFLSAITALVFAVVTFGS